MNVNYTDMTICYCIMPNTVLLLGTLKGGPAPYHGSHADHMLKIQDRITYKLLMLTYKSYYNIAPTYLCELISRRESYVNTNLLCHQLVRIV